MTNPTPQDHNAQPCRQEAVTNGQVAECNCPDCTGEPAGDAFVDSDEIDPHRRIVRARRPPQNSMISAGAVESDGAPGSDREGELLTVNNNNGNANRDSNNINNNDDDAGSGSLDRSGAIEFLRQHGLHHIPRHSNADAVEDDDANDENLPNEARGQVRVRDWQDEEEYEEEEAEASDDESTSGMPPPPHFMRGFLNSMSEMAMRSASRRSSHKNNLSGMIRPDDDDEESDDEDDDGGAQTCAACFRSDDENHKWRRLVTLPCCGADGRENISSTRFCAACILKLAVTRPHSSNTSEYRLIDEEPNEYPVKKFYQKSLQTDNRRFCECPRCRDILLVKIKGVKPVLEDEGGEGDDSSECECDCSDCEAERSERRSDRKDVKTARSISVHVPSFKAKCWYIGRKRGVAKLLWKVALLHYNFMPFEALGGDDEKANILKLTSWGIIEKKRDKQNIYQMDRASQAKLNRFFRLEKDPSEKDQNAEFKMITEMGMCMFYAAWCHLRDEYRVDRSVRIMNRLFFLGLHFFGYIPALPLSWWQEYMVTALNIFSVAMIVQFVCVILLYAVTFFGVGLSVCYVLKRSNNLRSIWWKVIVVSYLAYRLNKLFYKNPYLSWDVFVSPKAMVPVKTFLWG